MNDFGRYSSTSFSNILFPICPFSSTLSPKFDRIQHWSITQLVEFFTWEFYPVSQQSIKFQQISHLWSIIVNKLKIMLPNTIFSILPNS